MDKLSILTNTFPALCDYYDKAISNPCLTLSLSSNGRAGQIAISVSKIWVLAVSNQIGFNWAQGKFKNQWTQNIESLQPCP